jgi:hypothetical protein
MNLIELTNKAIEQINVYRNPDIEEWCNAIDPILKAAGQLMINGDAVDAIYFHYGFVCIETSYTSRGCDQHNSMKISVDILNSEDPIKAATLYYLEREIRECENQYSYSREQANRLEAKLKDLRAQLVANGG